MWGVPKGAPLSPFELLKCADGDLNRRARPMAGGARRRSQKFVAAGARRGRRAGPENDFARGYARPMSMTYAPTENARAALRLITSLQARFAQRLALIVQARGDDRPLALAAWVRDEGRHGGGSRFYAAETATFNRAAINISQVHYTDQPDKRLASATALSTIIHPAHPRAPSVHMHFSFTEMRDGKGTWRLMADLNPSIPHDEDTRRFEAAIAGADPAHAAAAKAQGAKYFYIPSLDRHRGVYHYYLESFSSGDFDADFALTQTVAETGIDTYSDILAQALGAAHAPPTDEQKQAQLAYHSLYLLQVLTLDRGTTSGLMVHNQNDVGIMGSLPAVVDRDLLASWIARQTAPQDELLRAIVDTLPAKNPAPVDNPTRQKLAEVVRAHYRAHPGALDLQAKGDVVPPTVQNHR